MGALGKVFLVLVILGLGFGLYYGYTSWSIPELHITPEKQALLQQVEQANPDLGEGYYEEKLTALVKETGAERITLMTPDGQIIELGEVDLS